MRPLEVPWSGLRRISENECERTIRLANATAAERDQLRVAAEEAAMDAEPNPEPAKGWRAWLPWKR